MFEIIGRSFNVDHFENVSEIFLIFTAYAACLGRHKKFFPDSPYSHMGTTLTIVFFSVRHFSKVELKPRTICILEVAYLGGKKEAYLNQQIVKSCAELSFIKEDSFSKLNSFDFISAKVFHSK